ncbi:hypothetical protein CC1G_03117 [Coprinopsis cinerea okayama7|uniref:FAD-binding domain-containing protein n=1 Tax=Coprinopsis cinerea (strain Okayama-7 / 130 / ATCC MYA-4618 / FGSC 9003) TaxID=240176 RepID=A8PF02_COPC7|nr:hypothetical protein CC1G_03117 [Coprinopsis cinerea okayama7\|eukprot:XP_001840888.1 hypothetical protein CC1G_03117 [Coprinopsis cinerea okayama7\
MQIIIVGGGISGLLTYVALRNHIAHSDSTISIKIVDNAKGPDDFTDGCSSFAPNAVRALCAVAPEVVPLLRQRGYSGGTISAHNSTGKVLGEFKAGAKERYDELQQLVVSHKALREVLMTLIDPGDIAWGKVVTGLFELSSGVQVTYTDGTTETTDLVIGADGARSIVKDAIFRGAHPNEFRGTVNVGAIVPTVELPVRFQKDLMTTGSAITFGKRGFFGYSLTSTSPSRDLFWWSVFFPPTSHPDLPTTEEVKSQLFHCVEGWKAPFDQGSDENAFESLLLLAFGNSDEEKPSKDTASTLLDTKQLIIQPRYSSARLPYFTNRNSSLAKGRIILVGEAAHVIPPETMQGAAFTIEDVAVYTLLLKHYSEAQGLVSKYRFSPSVYEAAAKGYDDLRVPRASQLMKSVGNGLDCDGGDEMGWFGEKLRDWAASLFCRFSDCVQEESFSYDPKKAVGDYVAKHEGCHA